MKRNETILNVMKRIEINGFDIGWNETNCFKYGNGYLRIIN
jgi:hypothetical protein